MYAWPYGQTLPIKNAVLHMGGAATAERSSATAPPAWRQPLAAKLLADRAIPEIWIIESGRVMESIAPERPSHSLRRHLWSRRDRSLIQPKGPWPGDAIDCFPRGGALHALRGLGHAQVLLHKPSRFDGIASANGAINHAMHLRGLAQICRALNGLAALVVKG